jgi:hypothetical protein
VPRNSVNETWYYAGSDGVVGPPRVGVTKQLLCGEEGLLHLRAVQEPKLGLDHPKPVIGFERLSCI